MTLLELEMKVNDSKAKVEKRINTLTKLCKKLNINSEEVLKKYYEVVNNNYEPYYLTKEQREEITNNYRRRLEKDENGNWLEKNFEYNCKISELQDNLYKLYDVEKVYHNWIVRYEKEENKEKVEKIPAIWEFLTNWETKTIDWYKENCKTYFELTINEKTKLEEYINSDYYKERYEREINHYDNQTNTIIYRVKSYLERKFLSNYYSNIDSFTKQITHFKYTYNNENYKTEKTNYVIDEEVLNKVIAKEKMDKYFDLVERATSIVGEITDATHLSIGNKQGELNGIIIGTKGKCRIETISAGGYNIQRFHYRLLIKEVK